MRKGLLLAFAFILAANAVTLAAVALNRRGEEATLVLTERELRLYPAGVENTGISLRLSWSRPRDVLEGDMPGFEWFDRETLAQVGFDVRPDPDDPASRDHYRRQAFAPREAYVVLEYRPDELPGAASETPLPLDPRDFRRRLTPEERALLPRLAPVDAGLDQAALRKAYPDRQRFVIMPGAVGLVYRPRESRPAGAEGPVLSGRVNVVYPMSIYVPEPHRAILERLRAEGAQAEGGMVEGRLTHAPRYRVTVTWGRGLEPWVAGVEPLEAEPAR